MPDNVPFCVVEGWSRPDQLSSDAVSGLMALTGRSDGPPLTPPPRLVRGLDRLVESIALSSARVGPELRVDWGLLLTTRARLLGLHRRGRCSANGTCRLMRGVDGWMAVNLARPEDLAAVEPLLQSDPGEDPWEALEASIARGQVAHFVDRARLLGIPAAPLGRLEGRVFPWSERQFCARRTGRALSDLRIVDLSSMWAGPLAARLIWDCGGRVTKVESSSRPDGARGRPDFYATLHPIEQEVITLDYGSAPGRRALEMLLADADVVLESSRPRALEQLGLSFDAVNARPGKGVGEHHGLRQKCPRARLGGFRGRLRRCCWPGGLGGRAQPGLLR